MKLAIILSSSNAETNWNVLRLANLALSKGDKVSMRPSRKKIFNVEKEQSRNYR